MEGIIKIKNEIALVKDECDDKAEEKILGEFIILKEEPVQVQTIKSEPAIDLGIDFDGSRLCSLDKFTTSNENDFTKDTPPTQETKLLTSTINYLMDGVSNGNGNELVAYNVCDYSTICSSEVSQKDKIKRKRKPYRCNYCGFHANTRKTIKVHIKNHSGQPYISYYTTIVSSFENVKKGFGERIFKCNLCDYTSKRFSQIREHSAKHNGEKPFVCKYCDFKSAYDASLRNHLALHTFEKPFVCNICNFAANRPYKLKAHLMTHTDEKPYSCHICSYRTRHTGCLRDHLATHSDERPFKCNVCSYRAKQMKRLREHMAIHCPEKPYVCSICDYKTVRRKSFLHHMNVHSKENRKIEKGKKSK